MTSLLAKKLQSGKYVLLNDKLVRRASSAARPATGNSKHFAKTIKELHRLYKIEEGRK